MKKMSDNEIIITLSIGKDRLYRWPMLPPLINAREKDDNWAYLLCFEMLNEE